jgi:L-iditol 2-dehydrogenase
MRALVWHGPHDLRLEEVAEPRTESGEALVKVSAVGICGSDIHGYSGASGRRAPGTVMGHELSGTIERADGPGAPAAGRRVAVNPLTTDGDCPYCRQGLPHLCPNRRVLGVNMGSEGGFADYVAVPTENLVPLAEGVSDEEGAMAEPLAVAVRAVDLSGLQAGEPALILGAGTIGLCVLLVCRSRGVDPVFITDRVPHRLEVAKTLGGEALDAEEDVTGRVLDATDGLGTSCNLDAVGIGPTIKQGLQATRRGGKLVLVGLANPQVDLALYELVPQERVIVGSYAYTPSEYRESVRLINERVVDVRPLIERTVPLEEAPDAFEALATGRDPSVKVMVEP